MGTMEAEVAHGVGIGGWVHQPLWLDEAALRTRADVQDVAFTVVCTLDGAHGGPRPMVGVPVRPLIEAAQPAFEQRTDFKRVAIVAESQEGYRALFSWGEVFNTDVGEGVMLAWASGHPEGPYALLSLHDHATGPRYVQGLRSITLQKLW